MRFLTFDQVKPFFRGKSVAVVGGAPCAVEHGHGFIDSHDIVVRVNNYATGLGQGHRCDVFYSFFGNSIRKEIHDLKRDGVKLLMCKCPDGVPFEPPEMEWHVRNNKMAGVDFRYIYRNRRGFWFADTFIPTEAHFRKSFLLLGKHIPTSGFSAILDVVACEPKSIYLTGYDFFSSGFHNNGMERWKPGDPRDPICHRPDLEREWLKANADKFTFDKTLAEICSP